MSEAIRQIVREELQPVEVRLTKAIADLREEHGRLIAENMRAIGDLTRAVNKPVNEIRGVKASQRPGGPPATGRETGGRYTGGPS